MKLLLAALLALSLPALAGAADGFRLNRTAFASAKTSASGGLVLEATEMFLSTSAAVRQAWMTETITDWRASSNGSPGAFTAVVWPSGGSLWRMAGKKAEQVEEWSDDRLPYAGSRNAAGRLFGFFGAQVVNGGAAEGNGLNLRLGTTLFDGRYDAAFTYSHNSVTKSPSYTANAYGVIGRALFPLSEHTGWNVGGQLLRSEVKGNTNGTVGVLAGLSFFVPGGSVDATVTAGSQGTYGLLFGYTVFFTNP